MTARKISVEEFDRLFDEGKEDILDYLDLEKTVVYEPGTTTKKVNVDFTTRQIRDLDDEAAYTGINRQAVIKTLCEEALMARKERRARLAEIATA